MTNKFKKPVPPDPDSPLLVPPFFDGGPEVGRAAMSAVSEHANRSTVAIMIEKGTTPHEIATGVLFEAAEHAFIVTAAHVLEGGAHLDKTAVVLRPIAPPVPLGGSTGFSRADCDIAMLPLNAEQRAALTESGARFLRQDSIDTLFSPRVWPPRPPEHLLCIYGFPAEALARNQDDKGGLHLRARRFVVPLAPTQGIFPAGFDPALEMALEYPSTEHASMYRSDGSQGAAMKPDGFSGCGVWSLPISRWKNWRPDDARLVAIQSSWVGPPGTRGQERLRCVRISEIVPLLTTCYPGLEQSLSLTIPSRTRIET